jgi:hypothetical protein
MPVDMSQSPTSIWREIPEVAADPSLSALYAEIRQCLETPQLPTLYRVVAAYGYLEEFWLLLKPLLQSPEADRFAVLARDIGLELAGEVAEVPLTLRDDIRVEVIQILESFNRGNPRNFLFSTAGRRLLGFEPAASRRVWQLAPEAKETATAGLEPVWNDIRQAHGAAAIPGFYRDVGVWPDVLRALWKRAKPLLATPELDEARTRLTDACREIVLAYPARQATRSETSADLASMLDWFVWANPTAILEIEYLRAQIYRSARYPGAFRPVAKRGLPEG